MKTPTKADDLFTADDAGEMLEHAGDRTYAHLAHVVEGVLPAPDPAAMLVLFKFSHFVKYWQGAELGVRYGGREDSPDLREQLEKWRLDLQQALDLYHAHIGDA